MRTIKFRAWDKSQKMMFPYMVHGNQLYVKFNGDVVSIDREGDEIPEHLELMQSTGLKDKNGKEIYEGDILVSPSFTNVKLEVKWDIKDTGWYPLKYWIGAKDIEVIGNIYENPELLP